MKIELSGERFVEIGGEESTEKLVIAVNTETVKDYILLSLGERDFIFNKNEVKDFFIAIIKEMNG